MTVEWTYDEILLKIKESISQFLTPDQELNLDTSFMESGLSSLDLVQFRQKLLEVFQGFVKLPAHFAFNYPNIEDVANHIYDQLSERNLIKIKNSKNGWNLLKNTDEGNPIFLLGGVVGSAEDTFGRISDNLQNPVYAYMPVIPAEVNIDKNNINIIAENLKEKLLEINSSDNITIGGLSFGATLAIELSLILEREGYKVNLILFDPRHIPPYVAPEDPAPFEILSEHYIPSARIKNKVKIIQTEEVFKENQSELMKESSRGFQNNEEVLKKTKEICTNLEIVKSKGHHFNLLYKHAEFVAKEINKVMTQEEK
ncbi:phosphopantetheine-binding protein, partial [Staphylococcus delphini]